jgi:hypothetical protein
MPARPATEHLRLVEVLGHLPHASNTTVLAAAADGSLWVYKPVAGEQPLWDFGWQTLAAREVLTFEVAEAMGTPIVPLTVVAEGPYGPGSAQQFLEEDEEWDPRPLFRPVLDPVLWPVAVLDVVTNNADRKVGHLLRDRPSGGLYAIDNGLTFHPAPKLRTVLWGFAGEPLPAEQVEAMERLMRALDAGLFDRVASMLGPAEARALAARTADLLASPCHPYPPDDRPAIPWPVW